MPIFAISLDAVLAGLEIQSAGAGEALELRVSISTGEVTIEAEDVFGPAVNLASRVQQVTPAGQVYLTETTARLLNAMEVSAIEIGDYELKGLPQPVKVYRAVVADKSR